MPPRVEWVMLWDDWLGDGLVGELSDLEIVVFFAAQTLCNRGPYEERRRGRLFVAPGVPVTPKHFAQKLGRPILAVERALARLCELGQEESLLYQSPGGVYAVRGWRTRQRADRGGSGVEGGDGQPERSTDVARTQPKHSTAAAQAQPVRPPQEEKKMQRVEIRPEGPDRPEGQRPLAVPECMSTRAVTQFGRATRGTAREAGAPALWPAGG